MTLIGADRIPAHLPRRLAIAFWDISWYTTSYPGGVYESLERVFQETVERGYNTIRLCAMPNLLFTPDGARPGPLRFAPLGGGIGRGTRWYWCLGDAVVDGHARLLELFRLARAYDVHVIVSSWEYQQSLSALESRAIFDELFGLPPAQRCNRMAATLSQLVGFLEAHGLADRIAYVELHNEVDQSRLIEGYAPGTPTIVALKPLVEAAVAWLRSAHPGILFSASYAEPSLDRMDSLADGLDVAHFHVYELGVIRDLEQAVGMDEVFQAQPLAGRDVAWSRPFPNEASRAIMRHDAPPFASWRLPAGNEWKLDANFLDLRSFYIHDWADRARFDAWVREREPAKRRAMRAGVRKRLEAMSAWATNQNIPAVIGEGWDGYPPQGSRLELEPAGRAHNDAAIELALELGFWGVMLSSMFNPTAPEWADVAWQRSWNERLLAG